MRDGSVKRRLIYVKEYDAALFSAVIILVFIGTFMVLSSSYYITGNSKAFNYNMFALFTKQLGWVAGGTFVMIVAAVVRYDSWWWFVYVMYAASNVLLVYVKFFGKVIHGARRWIIIGPVSLQPSEIAKIATLLLLAQILSNDRLLRQPLKRLFMLAGVTALPVALVLWGRNLSTALIILVIAFVMWFVTSKRFLPFVIAGGAGIAGLVGYLALGAGFRSARFAVWQDPFSDPLGTGYQIIQSLYAVASGGLFGLGPGQSNQKLLFLSEPYNDFIFAIVCEELGLFGAAVVLALFAVVVARGVKVAITARDTYGMLIAAGAITLIGVQVLINVAVVTNTIPNTGIPMPFISYGGTSLVMVMALMGVLLNISRYSEKGAYE